MPLTQEEQLELQQLESELGSSLDADLKQEEFGSLGQQAITAAEGLAEGALTSPVVTMLETRTGLSTPERIRNRAEVNPELKTGSELAGLGLSTFIPGTQGALLTKVGAAAAKGLGVAGKSGFIAKSADVAVRSALESGLYQAGKEVGDMMIADPATASEFSMADVGMATALGGVFGGAFGAAAAKLAGKGGAKVADEAAEKLVSSADMPAYEAGDLRTLVASDLEAPGRNKLLDAIDLGKKKANAKELEGIAKELGLPETPGMYLDKPAVELMVDMLSNSSYSVAGNRVRQQLDDAYMGVENLLKRSAGASDNLSKEQLGTRLQQTLDTKVRAEYEPIQKAYQELSQYHTQIPVKPEAIEGLAKALGSLDEVRLSGTDEGRLVKQVLATAKDVKSAQDLSTLRSMSALQDLSSAGGKDPLGRIKGIIRDEILKVQDDSVLRYAKSFPKNDEAGAMFGSLVEMAEGAKASYKPYIKKLSALSEWLGKGKVRGTEDALHFMQERLSASDVAQRMFSSSKDPQFMRFMQKEFPEQFGMIRDFQRAELMEGAMRNGEFSPKTFFTKFNKLEPEIQKSLYTPEELKRLGQVETYFKDAFPKNFNPSGTAHIQAARAAMEPKGLAVANLRDLAMEKFISYANNPDVRNAYSLASGVSKAYNMATKGIKSVLDSTKELPAKIIPIAAHRDKLDKLVVESAKDPSRLFAMGDNNPVPEYSTSMATTAARAVMFLNGIKPSTTPQSALDRPRTPTQGEVAAYNRALDIVQQPLFTIKLMKDGVLTTQDVNTLKSVYPGLYNSLSQQILEQITDVSSKGKQLPYQTRQMLSTFLGQPLDSSLKPLAIIAAQPVTQQDSAAAEQPQGKPPAASSMKGLEKGVAGARTPSQARSLEQSQGK